MFGFTSYSFVRSEMTQIFLDQNQGFGRTALLPEVSKGDSISLPFLSSRVYLQCLSYGSICPSSKPEAIGGVLTPHGSDLKSHYPLILILSPLLSPSAHFKESCDDTGSTQVISNNVSILKPAN